VLAADLTIRDASNTLLMTWTLSDPTDLIGTTVGGNRYGWFASQELPFLAFDNSRLAVATPPPPFAISDFHYHACAGTTCTSSDASSTAYRCTDVEIAGSACTVGTDEYNAGTAKHSYLIHITVANHSGGSLSSLKIQGGLTVSLLKSKPVYSIFSNDCGGTTKIDTSSKNNIVTLSGATLSNGSACDVVVEMYGVQFGTSAGHDAAISGTWSASARAGTTDYSAGPTGRLEVHIF
jgi:hypothetical protein